MDSDVVNYFVPYPPPINASDFISEFNLPSSIIEEEGCNLTEVRITWDAIDRLTSVLTTQVNDMITAQVSSRTQPKTAIVSIGRGGMAVAAILSHKLGIKDVHYLKVSSYNGKTPGQLKIDPMLCGISSYSELILVDDIVDTGATLSGVHKLLSTAYSDKSFIYATLISSCYSSCYTKNGRDSPVSIPPWGSDHKLVAPVSIPKEKKYWFVFPWEI